MTYSKLTIIFCAVFIACASQKQDMVYYEVTVGDYDVIVTGEGELEARNAHVLVTPMVRPAPTISFLIEEGSQVRKGDVIVKFTQTQLETEYLNALDELETVKVDSVKTEAELSLQLLLYESQYTTAKASVDAARLQLARIEFEAPITQEIKKLEIEQYETEAERAEKSLESLHKVQHEERIYAKLRMRQAQNKVDLAREQLNQLTLIAPLDGMVVYEISRITDEKVQEGNTLFPRMPVVRIPDLSVMQVKMQTSETDAQKLSVGMPASLIIPSLGNAAYPGKVVKIDRIAKAIQRNSKVKKVEVLVELDSTSQELRPGLTALAEVYVKRATNIISVPQESIFAHDSVRVVYVKEKKDYVPHPVASLYQDEDFMIVYSDLTEGEMLALHEPPNTRISWHDDLKPLRVPVEADTFKMAKREPPPEKSRGPREGERDMFNGISENNEGMWIEE